jgi:hypothetical protein
VVILLDNTAVEKVEDPLTWGGGDDVGIIKANTLSTFASVEGTVEIYVSKYTLLD